ncbi:Cell division membrane protein [Lactobacillus helsingborgensis]|uniref:YggT family protein n=1 Tax=Lactobacillus helsingborgensis TaxID=1218494 RepID=A0A0F4M157_9LACO|nr:MULTISPECIES: YggT family protein [Lactobacillus]MCT6866147.1 YggT family protein [Lactobacillus panisapium]AWN33360.1 YggT family protein [Lactobacillus helsingborgensis]KJY64747.1 Cell division membrane protein [Lactobacillus helsingborgensis]MBC6356188.1 YggT family protein [Lactobacillus helsingborgensis]MBI0110102.1 YggT family protein [Lactobacillus sp. W8093]
MAIRIIYYGIYILNYAIWIYSIVMVIDAILSWVPSMRDSAVGRIINRIIDPYLNLFRKGPIERLSQTIGIDISFLIGLLLLYFVQDYAIKWLANILFRIFA